MSSDSDVPVHIGFIVDGNRRWAKEHNLPSYEGHLRGYKVLQEVLLDVLDKGVSVVSAYVFSTENWQRSEDEVGRLMRLALRVFKSDLKLFHDNRIRLRILGDRDNLDKKLVKAIENAEAETSHYTDRTLALCFNYGGQAEITDAVRRIVEAGTIAEEVTPELIAQNLYAPDIPTCDLAVRTSGEQRLSNFMLWRTAYSELLFLEKNWPDMTKQDVTDILEEYKRRARRYGK